MAASINVRWQLWLLIIRRISASFRQRIAQVPGVSVTLLHCVVAVTAGYRSGDIGKVGALVGRPVIRIENIKPVPLVLREDENEE